jgi:inosine/xanthosine triphosphatase
MQQPYTEVDLLVAVGSLNPVKMAAARAVAAKVWSDTEVCFVAVSSGVSAQPSDDQETITGAINRAREACSKARADIGIGLEGGLSQKSFGTFTSEWCAIVDSRGRVWLGGGANLLVPSIVLEQIAQGYELGEAIDRLAGLQSCKTGPGTVGVLTHGLMDRYRCYEAVISYAIAPLLSPEFYI